MGGHVDWETIVDLGRVPKMAADWEGVADMLRTAALMYRSDRWKGQGVHVEVWCEKDALSSVLSPVAARHHVRYLACRGYASLTAIYSAAARLEEALTDGKRPVVIYLGDHNPSGLDMTRDIPERIRQMWVEDIEVRHLALTFDQVTSYGLPPNPAKLSDARAPAYVKEFGNDSWELDALEPNVLDALVSEEIEGFIDRDLWDAQQAVELTDIARLHELADAEEATDEEE